MARRWAGSKGQEFAVWKGRGSGQRGLEATAVFKPTRRLSRFLRTRVWGRGQVICDSRTRGHEGCVTQHGSAPDGLGRKAGHRW